MAVVDRRVNTTSPVNFGDTLISREGEVLEIDAHGLMHSLGFISKVISAEDKKTEPIQCDRCITERLKEGLYPLDVDLRDSIQNFILLGVDPARDDTELHINVKRRNIKFNFNNKKTSIIMQRILAALQGIVEKNKKDRKVKRVNRAIADARDNANDEIERLEDCKAFVIEKLSGDADVDSIITQLSDIIRLQEGQQIIIDSLNKIESYLNEEVEVAEKD